MIAPLEFIFGGGDVNSSMNFHGGAAAVATETFTKKCSEIKDKYGVPIGYSCVFTHDIQPFIHATTDANEDENVSEIDDDIYDTLFNRASNVRDQTKRKTKRARERAPAQKKSRRVSKKRSS